MPDRLFMLGAGKSKGTVENNYRARRAMGPRDMLTATITLGNQGSDHFSRWSLVDNLNQVARSTLMGRVKGKNTSPELAVRRAAHGAGYRFRVHSAKLPGRPDLVFPSRRKVIFVHGCFWHRHKGCRKASTPKTRVDFWQEKFARNLNRDAQNISSLSALGWKMLVVWECETKDSALLHSKIVSFLDDQSDMTLSN